jgi:hypothetical protein
MTNTLREIARACVAVAMIVAVTALGAPAMAQGTVGNKYAALFAINQKGGPALSAAIATAAAANPSEAQLIVEMAMLGTPEQQAAAAAGLAQAAQIATSSGNAEAAAAIATAVESAGGNLATAYASATGGSSDSNSEAAPRVIQTSSTSTTTNAPVSPSKP